MKKLICIILSLVLLAPCLNATASTMSDKYDQALELFMQNKYREAASILDEISIYNDASQLSMYCKSIAEGTEGNYAVAYSMLDMLGDYKDSKIWSIYFKACEAQEKGNDMLAYDLFSSIYLFRDSAKRMQGVQTGKNSDFKKEYSIDCSYISDGLIVVKKDDKCGYADIYGNIVIEPYWEDANPFDNGLAIVKYGFGTAYIIDRTGKSVIGSRWYGIVREGDFFHVMNYDYSASKVKLGLIDNKGTIILEAKYDDVDVLTNSCVAAKTGDKYVLYNMQGIEILEIQCKSIRGINNRLIVVENGDKYALYDSEGKALSGFVYDSVGYASEDLVSVSMEGKSGYVDLDGNVVIDLIYDNTFSFTKEGIARVQVNEKVGCIDKEGNISIPFEYEELGSFRDGKVIAKKDGKWGLIDLNNNVLISFEYDKLYDFSEGVSVAKKGGEKYGYIDEAGNTVIDFKWDSAGPFSDGLAFVADESGQYCINTKGDTVFTVPIAASQYYPFKDGVAIICKEGENENGRTSRKYGMIDNTGTVLIAPEYDSINSTGNGFYSIRNGKYPDRKEGLADSKGKMILDVKYNSISSFDDAGHSLVVGETTWFIIDTEGNIIF